MPSPKAHAQKTKTLSVSPGAAEAAFEKLLPRLGQIAASDLEVPRTGVDMAAIFALGVAEELNEPNARDKFGLLPRELFDMTNLDDLESIALATWHAATQLLTANAQGSEAKLPVSLVNEANEVKARMLRVADYHFDADTTQGHEVADIRLGTGYRDLAQDLARLAKLYRSSESALAGDKIWYREDDAARAAHLSYEIVKTLGESRNAEQRLWADRVQRAWALLTKVYDEVTSTAAWLTRNDASPAAYPSLITAGKAAPRRGRSVAQQEGDTKPEGV